MSIRYVDERLDSVAGLPVSRARADLGAVLLAAGQYGEAAGQFAAAIRDQPSASPAEQAGLTLLQACAVDNSGAADAAMRLYLDAVRLDGTLISDAAPRLNALLTPRSADALGPWITGDWAAAVTSSVAALPDSSRQRAQLAVLLAHVHALRRENAAAAQSLRDAIAASDEDVAAMATDLREWIATSLEDPAAGPRMQVLLAQLDLMLGNNAVALEHLDSALAAGLSDGTDLLEEASTYRLRGQALKALGRNEEAAKTLLEAARRYTWGEDWDQAQAQLRQVTELDPTVQEAWWLWANARYAAAMLAVRQDIARVDAGDLREALRLWENGARLGPPPAGASWAYQIAMAIYEVLARTDALTSPPDLWMAALLGERALQSGVDGRCWSELSAIYRGLGYAGVAAQLIKVADVGFGLTKDGTPTATLVLLEKAIDLLYLGRNDQVQLVLDEIDTPETDKTYLAPGLLPEVAGISAMVAGDLERARRSLEQSIADNPENFEAFTHLATCARKQGDWDAARRFNDRVLEETAPGVPGAAGRLSDRAEALYYAGRQAEAMPIFRQLSNACRQHGVNGAYVDAMLAFCHLSLGEPGAAPLLDGSARDITSGWLADEMAALLREFGDDHAAAFTGRAAEIANRENYEQAAEAELAGLLARTDLPPPVLVTSKAAIARTRLQAGNPQGAAELYGELLGERELYPEAGGTYLAAVQAHVTALLREDRSAEAAAAAGAALGRLADLAGSPVPQRRALLAGLASLAELRSSGYAEALRLIGEARSGLADAAGQELAGAIGEVWRESTGSPAAFWDAREHAGRCLAEQPASAETAFLDRVVRESERYLDDCFGLSAGLNADRRKRGEEPVTVTLGSGLVGEEAGGTTPIMLQHVSEIRARIKAGYGVVVPGVHLLDDTALPPEEFEIRLSGLLGVKSTARSFSEVAEALETFAVASLPKFLGSEEVNALVRAWAHENGEERLLEDKLPDDLAWVRLGMIAREKAAARIPLNWTEIFAALEPAERS
jgi:tetratricopeptide (TPR) repeat protein